MLEALANPHRLRILAHLHDQGPTYISQLARDVGISRPLLHMHLKRLEQGRLVTSEMGLSEDGKALNWYSVAPFSIDLTPQYISEMVRLLGPVPSNRKEK